MNAIWTYLSELASESWQGWNRFWFTPADPATLGLIRLLAGLILLYTHAAWSVDLLGFFGPTGRLPVEFVQQFREFFQQFQDSELTWSHLQDSELAWSYLYWVQSPTALWSVHLLALVVLLMFTLGLWTRVTSLLTLLITISYAHRTIGAQFGLDQVNGFLALYLAIGPSGAAYSLDNWLGRRSGRWGPEPRPSVSANIAQRLIQLHMCVVYLFAGAGKLLGESWWDGTALWGAFANFEYQTLDMTWLAAYPLLVNLLTQTILVWEVTYCVLVWPRLLRPLVLAMALPLHLGIGLSMGMMTFGLIMLVGNVAFVPSACVRSLFGSLFRQRVEQGRAGPLAV